MHAPRTADAQYFLTRSTQNYITALKRSCLICVAFYLCSCEAVLLLWSAVRWKVHSWPPFLLLGQGVPKLPFTLWLNPEASVSWWRPQPPQTEVTETRSSHQSHHTHLSIALPRSTSLHTCSPGFLSSPCYPHHDQESHASRPRIPHYTPWSSFLQLPGKSSTQCSPNPAALPPHDQDMPTGLLCWTCLQTPRACFRLSAFVDCFLSQEYSLQELWEEWEFLKSLVTQPTAPLSSDVTRFHCVPPAACWCLLWVSLTSGQFTSTWPLLSAILSPTSEIILSTQRNHAMNGKIWYSQRHY